MNNRKVGVCVIGSGRAGMIHARNFRSSVPYAKLVAVADPHEQTAREAARELELDHGYTDYRQALMNDAVDAVVVVTPTVYHKEIVVAAARAGKHVLCEKPMAMNPEECEEMIQACAEAGVKLQVAFMRRFDESFLEAKRQVEEGMIGDVVLVKSLTRGPSTPQPWMYDLKMSNGPLAEVNSHDIDTLRWFLGSEFSSVYAIGGNYRNKDVADRYPDFYDNVVLTGSARNGKLGVIDGAVSVGYGYDARVEILGTEGVIFIGQTHEKTLVTANGGKQLTRPFMNSWRSLYKDAYLAEDTHFIACILEDRQPRVGGIDGKMAAAVVHAGNASLARKAIVQLE
ncbi:Gfo/Idh/MocA family oxidoreductase [Cohnella cellulosilytica]|uniref:Gfo/Idh/MocA family oxidoreductase n=1 Tax=Cohnella cellulosilytica TaxID=986710 RepID=A0ABW2FLU8_9BACL